MACVVDALAGDRYRPSTVAQRLNEQLAVRLDDAFNRVEQGFARVLTHVLIRLRLEHAVKSG